MSGETLLQALAHCVVLEQNADGVTTLELRTKALLVHIVGRCASRNEMNVFARIDANRIGKLAVQPQAGSNDHVRLLSMEVEESSK